MLLLILLVARTALVMLGGASSLYRQEALLPRPNEDGRRNNSPSGLLFIIQLPNNLRH